MFSFRDYCNSINHEQARQIAVSKINTYLNSLHWDGSLETIYLYTNFTCNEQCQYCWIHNSDVDSSKMVDMRLLDRFMHDAPSMGLKRIKISGGEPLVNPIIAQIINYLSSFGLVVEIETNATKINELFLSQLVKPTNVLFKVSLDTIYSEGNDIITNRKNSLIETLDGIKCLRKNNLNFDIITVATTLNYENLHELINYVRGLGASTHRIILNIQPIGHGLDAENLNLSLSQIEILMDYVYDLNDEFINFGTLHSTLPPAFVPLDRLDLSFCAWGEAMCGIMPNGDVSVCAPAFNSLSIVAGNVFDANLKDIWKSSRLFSNLREIEALEGICGNCIFASACRGMCRIFAKAKYGKFTSPYPFCQEMYNNGLFPQYAMKNIKDGK